MLNRYSRRTRIGLLALLGVTILFAAGALFIKYKLEGLRGDVEREVEARTGARLRVGAILVNGLRGLRLDDVEIGLESGAGPTVSLSTPVVYINLDIVDLLSGEISIERVQVDRSVIRLSRPVDSPWVASDTFELKKTSLGGLSSPPAFRVLGKDSTLEILNVVGDTHLAIKNFSFDVSRLSGSPDITAKVSGTLGEDSAKELKVDLRFTSAEDFDLRVHCAGVTADDVKVFFPASERFVQSGRASASLRLAGYPGMMLVIAFDASFEDLAIRNQPDFILPAKGILTGVANYDSTKRLLTLTTAKAESDQLGGRLEGSISFETGLPEFDLRLEATELPVAEALNYALQGRGEEYGHFDVQLEDPYEARLLLQGTPENPVISVQGQAGGGAFAFEPKDKTLPKGRLRLGTMTLSWHSGTARPTGTFTVLDGTLDHEMSGISAQKISGVLIVDEQQIRVDPLNAEIGGNPLVGSLVYDLEADRLECSIDGTLANIEDTILANAIDDFSLSGTVRARCHVVRTANKIVLDAEADATDTEVGIKWWFLKPQGTGASVRNFHFEMVPKKKMSFTGDANVAGTDLHAVADFDYLKRQKLVKGEMKDKTWLTRSLVLTSDNLDVVSAGKCIRLPYTFSGGLGKSMRYEQRRDASAPEDERSTVSGKIDDLVLLPEGGDVPMHCEGIEAEVTWWTNGEEKTGTVVLHAAKGTMPPLGGVFFVPPDPELMALYDDDDEPDNRKWTFTLSGDSVCVPPWHGTDFTGEAYDFPDESGFKSFQANLEEGGTIQGRYHNMKEDNVFEAHFAWDGIPVSCLIEELEYPKIVTGTVTGEVSYSMDQDDPGTIKGEGNFEVRDGQFSADYLTQRLEGQLGNEISAITPSLKFSSLKTQLTFEGDLITTTGLELVSPGIKISGNGFFVTDGDMDYDLDVALSPEMAEKIPVLRDNFNVAGMRLAQQDIELAFKVKGPIFNPQGELAELPPIGITLVSSALERTSDAMRVIDIPRKMLLDLLKIGGGIVVKPK